MAGRKPLYDDLIVSKNEITDVNKRELTIDIAQTIQSRAKMLGYKFERKTIRGKITLFKKV